MSAWELCYRPLQFLLLQHLSWDRQNPLRASSPQPLGSFAVLRSHRFHFKAGKSLFLDLLAGKGRHERQSGQVALTISQQPSLALRHRPDQEKLVSNSHD